jgi:hypothetical protein
MLVFYGDESKICCGLNGVNAQMTFFKKVIYPIVDI